MNILEAIKNIDEGKIIRKPAMYSSTIFYVQATLIPFNEYKIAEIYVRQKYRCAEMPHTVSELKWDAVENIDIDNIRAEDYELVTEEEMIKEIQEAWKRGNEQ